MFGRREEGVWLQFGLESLLPCYLLGMFHDIGFNCLCLSGLNDIMSVNEDVSGCMVVVSL